MAARGSVWPLVRAVARRLALRDAPPGPAVTRGLWLCGALGSVAAVLLLAGVSSLALVAVVGVASLLTMAFAALRWFPPSMAVSVIGVALSCASLLTALSVTSGFRLEILEAVARVNGHVLLTKYGLDFFEYEAIADTWKQDPRVTAASPFAYSMAAIVGPVPDPRALADEGWPSEAGDDERVSTGPAVVVAKGIDPTRAADLDGLVEVLEGGSLAALRPGDSQHPPGIVLGAALAHRLGVAPGEFVRVVVPAELDGSGQAMGGPPRHATFEVLDLLQTGTSEFDRNFALMHLTAAQSVFFREGRVTGIEFQLTHPDLAEAVAEAMHDELGFPYRTSTWRETNAAVLVGLEQIRVGLMLVLGLMVLVAASSLVASLLLVVRRKRHDIAVLMALGADHTAVFWMFEALGILVGLVGALLGIALGLLYCAIIGRFRFPLGGDVYPVDHLPVVLQAQDVLGPAAVAVGLCAIASGPIAVLASQVRVMEALRR